VLVLAATAFGIAGGTLMTHKYRGSQQSSREVKPNLLIRHQGSQRIFVSLNSGVVNSAAPENRLARKNLSVATSCIAVAVVKYQQQCNKDSSSDYSKQQD
jgi:hypothetical protein